MTITNPIHTEAPPWWDAYVTVTVELGIGVGAEAPNPGLWDVAEWDDAASGTWSGLEPEWVPVDACRLLDLGVNRGRARVFDRFPASSATVTLADPDGSLSWDSADEDDTLEVRPGRPIRFRALHRDSGAVNTLWRGWLESIEDGFTPGGPPPARFTCQDALAQLAHVDLPEQAPVGAGDTSDERVHRLLDAAGWPTEWRDVDAGTITVQATNLARNIVDDLGVTADSEGGALFADRDGNIAFRNRDWLRTAPYATTVQGDIGGPLQTICGASYDLIRTGADIVNDVQVARAGGTMQRVTNPTSIALYRHRSWSRGDYIMETDAEALLLADLILDARSSGTARMPKITIRGTNDEATWAFMLAVDYGWLIDVHYRSPFDPTVNWARRVQVQGVEHRVTTTEWVTTLAVDDVYVGAAASVWDTNAGWDASLWSEPI